MPSDEPGAVTLAARWLREAHAVLERIEATQLDAIERVSRVCAAAIAGGGMVHLFGTGHSRIPVEEMFPRYASYPGFHPIIELSASFHGQIVGASGLRQSMAIERTPGLAEAILSNFELGAADAMIVFSAGGINTLPLEVAMAAKRRGLTVIAVTSVAQSMGTRAMHASGSRLLDHADIVLDLCTPPEDGVVTLPGVSAAVGPTTTLAAVAIVNALKARTAELLHERGALPPVIEAPSAGEARASESLRAALAEHARRLSRILR